MPSPAAIERGDRYEELRALLLGPERQALESLRERLENPKRRAEDVAGVLADAVRLRPDTRLKRALQPLMEEALQLSVRRNPRVLVEALFPIFGQAIRRMIQAELEQRSESLSQAMERKISLRSVEWRLEAMRTGRPYAEIVMLRSLLYKVEQVFLIHRKTGLLLRHAAAPDADARDPEMVSGMLTAIQDFVHDSMRGTDSDNLDLVRMGDVGVVLAYTTDAILCGFVRGVPPRSLSRLFQDKLDEIEREKVEALRSFSGETAEFESCRPQLEACLVGAGKSLEKSRNPSVPRLLLFAVPALLIGALLGWWFYSSLLSHRFSELTRRVEAQPGIVVTQAERRGGEFIIGGLRDPLAPDPASLLAAAGLPAGGVRFEWHDFHSLAPRFAAQRKYLELKEQLEKRGFRFRVGAAEIPPEQHFLLEDFAAQILALLRAGTEAGKSPLITVRGNHDPLGTERMNSGLAIARAANVTTALIALGVPGARLAAEAADREREACSAVGEEERFECRSAVFSVREASAP